MRNQKAVKGQAAMEFLMTYGWALLIVVIVGAVVFLVVRPSGLVGEAKVGFSGVDVVRFGLDSNTDDLQMQLQNRRADAITIDKVYVEPVAGGAGNSTTKSIALNPGQRTSGFELADTPLNVNSGDSYSYKVAIQYYFTDVGSGTKFNSTGTLSGTAS